jgi:CubicO group peptidase (beta-lactamase class C family)
VRRAIVILVVAVMGCRTATIPNRLDAFFSDLHARGLFDGAVVVGRGPDEIFARGYGLANREQRTPFTPDTAADGASLAKTFTAALVLELESEGKLRLDDAAQRLLPELPYPNITLRHLLMHRTGLPDYDWFDAALPRDQVRTTEVLLGAIAAKKPPLAFEPGTAFEYSSFSYDLALLAAERAAGKPYGDLLAERFFRPLGMTSAFLRPGRLREFPGVRTIGYRGDNVHDVFDYEAFHGGSNIYISARDLHRWNASFFTRPSPDAPSPLSLGNWYHSGSQYSYAGHLQGFHDEVYRDLKTRRSIVYMSNNTIDPWVQHAIVRSVNAILDGHAPETVGTLATEAAPLAGTWRTATGETITIAQTGDHLSVVHDGLHVRMVQVKPNTYYAPGLDYVMGYAKGSLHVSTNFALRTFSNASTRIEV